MKGMTKSLRAARNGNALQQVPERTRATAVTLINGWKGAEENGR